MSENTFESREQVYESLSDLRQSAMHTLLPQATLQNDLDFVSIGDDDANGIYQYSFKLNSNAEKEIDVTVHDSQVVVVASDNERSSAGSLNLTSSLSNVLPPVTLSCMLPIPDDAETNTVKVKLHANQLIITFTRATNGDKIDAVRGRKLFVQSD